MSHGKKHRDNRPPKVDIPITAMLDMSFQLLFFFILNYKPSALEGQMDMALPAKLEAASKEKENPNPVPSDKPDDDIKLPADLTISIKAVRDGSPIHGTIAQLSVRSRSGDSIIPSTDALTDHLEKAKDKAENKEDVTIIGDSALRWSEVVKVMDACRKAGFRAGFGAPPDLNVSQ
jgi:biopolymer transport protein ExbD